MCPSHGFSTEPLVLGALLGRWELFSRRPLPLSILLQGMKAWPSGVPGHPCFKQNNLRSCWGPLLSQKLTDFSFHSTVMHGCLLTGAALHPEHTLLFTCLFWRLCQALTSLQSTCPTPHRLGTRASETCFVASQTSPARSIATLGNLTSNSIHTRRAGIVPDSQGLTHYRYMINIGGMNECKENGTRCGTMKI